MESIAVIMILHQHGQLMEDLQVGAEVSRHESAVDWDRVVYDSLSRICGSGTENLVSASLYTSEDQDVLICFVNSPQGFTYLTTKLSSTSFGISTQWQIYAPLAFHLEPAQIANEAAHILVCNAMTPTPQNEEDFNNWYNDEHILLLSRSPGWMRSARYRLVDCSHDAPRYLAMHAWKSRSAFETPEYKLAVETPWKVRVVDKVTARERHVYDYAYDLQKLAG
ncbi:hypothetical protein BDZ97DRAFT_1758439 [Flammula alnicola]|nr:hypothetical protein BDZ97DRAFT_1758439 [Flammula alnicola]